MCSYMDIYVYLYVYEFIFKRICIKSYMYVYKFYGNYGGFNREKRDIG